MPSKAILFQVERDTPVTFCKRCPQTIVWLRTRKGKMMPVDVAPDNVRVTLVREGGTEVICMHVGAPFEGTAHWATCPEAASFRRTK